MKISLVNTCTCICWFMILHVHVVVHFYIWFFFSSQDEVGEVEDVEMEVDDTEPDTIQQKGSEDMETTPLPPPTPLVSSLSNNSANLQIRKDYDPKGTVQYMYNCKSYMCTVHLSSWVSTWSFRCTCILYNGVEPLHCRHHWNQSICFEFRGIHSSGVVLCRFANVPVLIWEVSYAHLVSLYFHNLTLYTYT